MSRLYAACSSAGTRGWLSTISPQATGHSKSLVREYLDLIEQFKLPPIADPAGADSVQADPTSMPNDT